MGSRQPITGMDVERQTPAEILDNNNEDARFCFTSCLLPIVSIAILACMIFLTEYYRVNAHYSVALDSVSVLEHKTGLSFNLTLGVASRSHGAKACIDPGMFVEVFYRGVKVGTSDAAETRRTCAKPRNMASLPIVARATMTPVFANVAAEMAQVAAVFDSKLHVAAGSYLHRGKSCTESWVSDCKGSRIGATAVPCGSPIYTKQCINI